MLVAGLDQTTGAVQSDIRSDLSRRLDSMERDSSWQSWPSFHGARWQAYQMLNELRKAGKLQVGALSGSP